MKTIGHINGHGKYNCLTLKDGIVYHKKCYCILHQAIIKWELGNILNSYALEEENITQAIHYILMKLLNIILIMFFNYTRLHHRVGGPGVSFGV